MHTIYIVRHGETDANAQQIIQGQLDTHLNTLGIIQAKKTGQALKNLPLTACFSSDLSRAAKTAQFILEQRPEVDLQYVASLRERHLGVLQGLTYSTYQMRLGNPKDTSHPDFESKEQSGKRITDWWLSTIPQFLSTATTPQTLLIVSHGSVISSLIQSLIKLQVFSQGTGVVYYPGIKLHNSSITIVHMSEDGQSGQLKQFGDVKHLNNDLDEDDNADASVE